MDNETEVKLSKSSTTENTNIMPYLPYLVQDIWNLSRPHNNIIKLIKNNIKNTDKIRILDLAGGKGGVSIPLAKELQAYIKIVDIIPEFIEEANKKAIEYKLKKDQYELKIDDINNTIINERNWDLILFCGGGNILGNPKETIHKLSKIIKPNGHIIFDGGQIKDNSLEKNLRYKKHIYLTQDKWIKIFKSNDLKIIDKIISDGKKFSNTNKLNTKLITKRAKELKEKYPQLSPLLNNYVQGQKDGVHDLENTITALTWLLQKTK
ncbi:MAG: class I SAM-dependent methyltransferase [Methanobacteriaceae archaeon]